MKLPLVNLKEQDYKDLMATGMLYEHYPEATGNYENDVTIPYQEMLDRMFKRGEEIHRIYHKFSKWLVNTFGKDLKSKRKVKFTLQDGKKKVFYVTDYNEYELEKRISGYDAIVKIENYVKRSCPEIKIVGCDDSVHAGSILLLIPHPDFGITVMFVPQCTTTQNKFFLYGNHFKMLQEELEKMKIIYPKIDLL
jgi:hypothetical protein